MKKYMLFLFLQSSPFEKAWEEVYISYFKKEYTLALDKFQNLIDKFPSHINFKNLTQIYFMMGNWTYYKEEYNKSLTYINSAICLPPYSSNA